MSGAELAELWNKACEVAGVHCPMEVGESHVTMGVPKLAAKVVALADEVQRLRRELYKQDEHHGRYFITKELDAQREQIAAWFDRNQSEDMKNICLLCASRAAADIRARKDEAK